MTSRGTLDEKLRCKSCPLGSIGQPLGVSRPEGGQRTGPGHLSRAERVARTFCLPFQVRGGLLEAAVQEEHSLARWGRQMGQAQRGHPAGVAMGPLAVQPGVKGPYPVLDPVLVTDLIHLLIHSLTQ